MSDPIDLRTSLLDLLHPLSAHLLASTWIPRDLGAELGHENECWHAFLPTPVHGLADASEPNARVPLASFGLRGVVKGRGDGTEGREEVDGRRPKWKADGMCLERSWISLVLVMACLTPGCKKSGAPKPGHWVACTCPYLTDYDDVAKHQLEVCVAEGVKPEEAAYGCASKLTHGPAEACTCGPPKGPCESADACKSKEYK